jgi:hypothetical protein
VETARKIQASAEQLLNQLRSHQMEYQRAIWLGYLPTPDPREIGTLAELNGMGWVVDRLARQILTRLASEVGTWARRAKNHAQKPGRLTPRVKSRRSLAKYVAETLAKAELPPAKSKTGAFARVLKAVYQVAGIPTKDVYRDVAWAVEELIADLQRQIAEADRHSAEKQAKIQRLEAAIQVQKSVAQKRR